MFFRAEEISQSWIYGATGHFRRSHAVFLLRGAGGELLQLVDLAGSEDPRKHNSELRSPLGPRAELAGTTPLSSWV